jgi:hypothetical protein
MYTVTLSDFDSEMPPQCFVTLEEAKEWIYDQDWGHTGEISIEDFTGAVVFLEDALDIRSEQVETNRGPFADTAPENSDS